jgi:AcrR family transcriptional regulator
MIVPVRKSSRAEARAESQRERILDAAQRCFVDHGFHAASMAQIAQAAGISVGLAYRYFDGKHAIVLAIIARQLETKRARIEEFCGCDDLLEALLARVRAWQAGSPDDMNATLFLEMSAEASRSPEIASAIRASDALLRDEFEGWLRRDPRAGGRGLSADDARLRVVLVQCLVEGLLVRAARDPELDAGTIRRALGPVIERLGLGPRAQPCAPPAGAVEP